MHVFTKNLDNLHQVRAFQRIGQLYLKNSHSPLTR